MLPHRALTILSLAATAAAQGFWRNCSRWALGWEDGAVYRRFMVAECADESMRTRASFLPLSDCLANIEGEMVPRRSGGIAASCADCTTEDSLLTCRCARSFGGPITTTADLDIVISNVDGILGCHDFLGVEIDTFESHPA